MDIYQFTYQVYARRFRQPLHTSHGVWKIRSGIIIQLVDRTATSYPGEIAPIPWFGSESIEQAIDYCESIGDRITHSQIQEIPDLLPACQFGFGSALIAAETQFTHPIPVIDKISGLLPTGIAAITAWEDLAKQGYSTFKWKIGVLDLDREIAIWHQLIDILPTNIKLRLDANGGLTYAAAEKWLEICDREPKIEFIEQPLPIDSVAQTIELNNKYATPIALDESVATFDRLQTIHQLGWRGIYVIKPGIAGFPWRLAKFINQHQLDVVFSSVLETEIGKTAAIQLASELKLNRAMGFGVEHWFEQGE